MTSMGDIAVSDNVRIAGDCVSLTDIAGYMRKLADSSPSMSLSKPIPAVQITQLNSEAERKRLYEEWRAGRAGRPDDFIR